MRDFFAWVEKYRPDCLKDMVLPIRIYSVLDDIIKKGDMPNLILQGNAGTGKTTAAKMLAKELDFGVLVINGSDDRNIDMIRTTLANYASSSSMNGKPKIVLIDEADYLNPQSTQPAMRSFMEEYSKFVRFIFTVNYPEKIIDPLKSRMTMLEFNLNKEEQKEIARKWLDRIKFILDSENVNYDGKERLIVQGIKAHFPDFRKTINEFQKYCVNGNIDVAVISDSKKSDIDELISVMKRKSFSACKEWVYQNSCMTTDDVIMGLWKKINSFIAVSSQGIFVILANQYSRDSKMVISHEISTLSFLTELMAEVEFV